MEKTRVKWIDVTRGIAFLMVIYSHQKYCNEGLMYYFYPVFLTTFFFISGYLFKRNFSFRQLLEHRLRTLLLPFVIFGFVNILLSQLMSFNEHPSLKQDVLDFLVQIRGRNDGLWFIAALFVMNFPFYLMVKYAKNIKILTMISFIFFILSTIYTYYLKLPALPWHIQFIGFGCFYMALGYLYKQYEKKIFFLEKKGVVLLSLFLYVSILFIAHSLLQRTPVSFYGSFYIVDALVITTVGIFMMVKLSELGGGGYFPS